MKYVLNSTTKQVLYYGGYIDDPELDVNEELIETDQVLFQD